MKKDIKATIVRLLAETASSSTAQATRNLKRANELLTDNDMTWSMLFGKYSHASVATKTESEVDLEEVDNMFSALSAVELPESTREFIDDLNHAYAVYDTLTPKQYEALKRNYKRFC